ncbi:hypothetical protein QYE76_003314 [Lolium multiflorum]|uniref:Uncharacterized protein n=1 Tax=Lolium multiflorum TaxID=4521 RepID=A0AAD8W0C9_LOLMU|nr:hypothetical protein QYE76_003314 [Lolium multiflorum]
MSRPHQLWLYSGKNDKSRVSLADLSADELRDEVHRLTCLCMKDNIVLTSARPPYDLHHLPAEVILAVSRFYCYRYDVLHRVLYANHLLFLSSSDDDDDVPLAKRAKLFFGKSESAKESIPSPAKPTPPSRTTVEKVPLSKVIPSGNAPASSVARDHPIYAMVDAVVDFAEQFTRLESENAHLRKVIKTSADQVLEANRLAADAKNENTSLKDELKRLKRQMKDEQDAKREAAAAADKKEGVLRESITNLLEEPMEMTFGKFHFRVEKEGAYRLEIPITSGLSAVDPDFSSSASSIESGGEETLSPRFISTRASEKLAKIFSDMSFESSADSDISDDSSNIDSFNFIDRSTIVGEVFTNLHDGVTKPNKIQNPKYHQIYAIEEPSREQEETSEAFDDVGNPYVYPADLRRAVTMCSGGDGGDDDGDDDDGDGDDVQLDGDDDGVDFPLREGISPADLSLPESSFSLVFSPRAAVTLRDLLPGA